MLPTASLSLGNRSSLLWAQTSRWRCSSCREAWTSRASWWRTRSFSRVASTDRTPNRSSRMAVTPFRVIVLSLRCLRRHPRLSTQIGLTTIRAIKINSLTYRSITGKQGFWELRAKSQPRPRVIKVELWSDRIKKMTLGWCICKEMRVSWFKSLKN